MANDITPMVNGLRHSWSSVRFPLFGRTVTGISSITYSSDDKFEDHPGGGGQVSHRTVEFDKASVEIEVYNFEFDAITKAMAGKSFRDVLMQDIPVVFKPQGSDGLVTDVIHNVNITGWGKSFKTGDGKLVTKLKCICSHITPNIQ